VAVAAVVTTHVAHSATTIFALAAATSTSTTTTTTTTTTSNALISKMFLSQTTQKIAT
jgi:hypothetical protein